MKPPQSSITPQQFHGGFPEQPRLPQEWEPASPVSYSSKMLVFAGDGGHYRDPASQNDHSTIINQQVPSTAPASEIGDRVEEESERL